MNIVIYVNWADNRRRDIYYHFLSRHGYQYGRDLDDEIHLREAREDRDTARMYFSEAEDYRRRADEYYDKYQNYKSQADYYA